MAYIKIVERGQTQKYKDSDSYKDLVEYCCHPSKAIYIEIININSISTAASEMETVANQFRKNYGTRVSHIIISFSHQELSSPGIAESIAHQCLQYFANRYQAICCIHSNPQIHLHIVMNRVSILDGKKYPDRYEDRRQLWLYMRQVMNGFGLYLWK